MADIVDVYNAEKETPIKRRQLPLHVHESLTMVMDLNPVGLVCDNPQVKGRDIDDFMIKYKCLNADELKDACTVDANDVFNVLNQTIPCVGCRRSVERLFYQLCKSGHPTLDPLVFKSNNTIHIRDDKTNPFSLGTLLSGHSAGIKLIVPGQSRWKKSQRCALHSLEAGCTGGLGLIRTWAGSWGARPAWRVAWECMRAPARAHITLIQYSTLHDTLHSYLKKHRFCIDCKTKVLRACLLLVDEKVPEKEKGFIPALYNGIKCCYSDKHLHLQPKTDYISQLIGRAEPDLLGSHRERHAKTMEIAQEEVLICLGICMYERLQRISNRMREEENMCQTLAAVSVEALYRKFETTLEQRRGVSKLQLLYDELAQEEITRQQRKEQKKLKKRRKKERLAVENKCKEQDSEEPEDKCSCEECSEERDTPTELLSTRDCAACSGECNCCHEIKNTRKLTKTGSLSPNDHSQDCGYSSGNNGGCCETMSGCSSLMSSPEGSEVACSDGFCNHERGDYSDTSKPCKHAAGFTLTLQEMLMDTGSTDDEEDTSYIPIEEILEFKSRGNVTEKREELRQNLRQRFAQLCVNVPPVSNSKPQKQSV